MRVAIGLGCSMGDRHATLARAVNTLSATTGLRMRAVSRWYRSPPMSGGKAQGWFLNGVALFDTTLTPRQVLERCRELEARAGRRRRLFWADRPLDLDVLAFEGHRSDDLELTLPHPGILSRPFVWIPLREVWPDAVEGLSEAAQDPPGIAAVGVFAHARSPA